MSHFMKAARIQRIGDVSVLEYGDYSMPMVGDNDVLVTGVSGGIGNAIAQWAKVQGAVVIGKTTQQNKMDEIKKLGVDHVICTNDLKQASKTVQEITGGLGVNHAVELTAVESLKVFCLQNLAVGSVYCPVAESNQNDSVLADVKKRIWLVWS